MKYWTSHKKQVMTCVVVAVVFILLTLLPLFISSPYIMHLVVMALIFSVLGMTFSMLFAAGRMSLGAGAFFVFGAYMSTILSMKMGCSFWLALPLTAIISGIVSLGIGAIIIRGSGFSFGIITLMIAMAVTQIPGEIPYLGGWAGFIGIPGPEPVPVPFHKPIEFVGKTPYFYLILFLFLLIVICFYAFYSSRIGRTWKAIRLSPNLAESLGINLYRYRLLAFVASSIPAAVVGSFYVHYYHVIEPTSFSGFFSITIQLYAVLGGLNYYILGPIIGAAIMTFVPEFLRITNEYNPIITGFILIIIILFFRGGILGNLAAFSRSNFFRKILGKTQAT